MARADPAARLARGVPPAARTSTARRLRDLLPTLHRLQTRAAGRTAGFPETQGPYGTRIAYTAPAAVRGDHLNRHNSFRGHACRLRPTPFVPSGVYLRSWPEGSAGREGTRADPAPPTARGWLASQGDV